MKNRKLKIIILLILIVISFILNRNELLMNKKQIIKEMSESTQVSDLNNSIDRLNSEQDEYKKYITTSKTNLANAITSAGVSTSGTDSFETMASNIKSIARSNGYTNVDFTNMLKVTNSDSITSNSNMKLAILVAFTYSSTGYCEITSATSNGNCIIENLYCKYIARTNSTANSLAIYKLTNVSSNEVFNVSSNLQHAKQIYLIEIPATFSDVSYYTSTNGTNPGEYSVDISEDITNALIVGSGSSTVGNIPITLLSDCGRITEVATSVVNISSSNNLNNSIKRIEMINNSSKIYMLASHNYAWNMAVIKLH